MAIDFVRASSSKIACSSVPVGVKPVMLECWCKIDGWTGGVSYGALMGIYNTTTSLRMTLRIKKTLAVPPYLAEFVVTNYSGTFTAGTTAFSLDTNWHHILGYWRSTNPYTIQVYWDGTPGTGTASSGLFLGANAYDFGWDPVSSGDHFDGQICEWVAWAENITGGTGLKPAQIACKGFNPIDRPPFHGGTLRSWIAGHNTSVIDILRPSTTYTETSVTTVEDHPETFEAPRPARFPYTAPEAVAGRPRRGIAHSPTLIV